jgi:hypothetical protein
MRWWRAYEEAATDPKLQLLPAELFRTWFNLMCIASKNGGELPALAHLSYTLQMKPEKAAQALAQLHKVGLLDKTDTGFAPHNWNGRQYKSDATDETAAERMRRYRERRRNNRNGDVTVTVPREQITETDTEKEETRASALIDDDWPKDFREQFWNRYPNKVGKPKALAKLEGARKRKVPWRSIMDGLERYIRDKPADRAWLNPETFVNQERWNDQPANAGHKPDLSPVPPSHIDWDAVLTSFKRFGVWSKHAGPDLDSPECRAPPDMLTKYGLARAPIAPPTIPHLRSMDS